MKKRLIAILLAAIMVLPVPVFAGIEEAEAAPADNIEITMENGAEAADDTADAASPAAVDTAEEMPVLSEEAGDNSADESVPAEPEEEAPAEDVMSQEAGEGELQLTIEDPAMAGESEWVAGDFTYEDQDLEQKFPTYPATHTTQKLTGSVHVITGFSETGAAKLESNTDLVIPSTDPDGRTIQGVASSAFSGKGLTSLTLPSGIMTDNGGKWYEDVTTRGDFFIGNSAFSSNNFTELTIPEGVIFIGLGAFSRNKLTKVTFPRTVLNIASQAFANNALTELKFPDTTIFPVELDNMAFASNKLTEVYLPAKTMKVNKWAFFQNTGMEPVTVGTDNEKQGGIVYMHIADPGSYIEDTTNGKSNVQKLIEEQYDPGNNTGEDPGDDPSGEEQSDAWTTADFTFGEYEYYGVKGQRLYGCDYSRDFTITGIAVTGFSEQGEKKLETNKDLVIPATDQNGTQIMGVARDAFSNKGLTSVKFPTGMLVPYDDQVTYRVTKRGNYVIGDNAFSGNKLTSVNLPDGVIAVMTYAFNNNELTQVTLPKTIWWVENMAFANNNISKVRFPETTYFQFEMHGAPFGGNKIKSVRLPDYTKVIDKKAFMLNPGMERLTDEQLRKAFNTTAYDNLTEEEKANIGIVYMYTDTVDMGDIDRIHHIDQQTESTKSYFQKLIINDGTPGTQYVDEDAWNINDFTVQGTKITGLSESGKEKRKVNKDLVIPDFNKNYDRITEIADAPVQTGGLFATADEKFDTVTLPSSLLRIGDNAFREAGLTDVAFPPELEEIGTTAFQMNDLTSIVLPDTVTYVGQGAFASNKNIERIELSSGLTEIADGAFGCSDMDNWMAKLTKIEIPEGITRIGSRAFAGNNFQSIYIPDGVTEIGEYAFSTKNYLLTQQEKDCDVRLPESLTTIGNRAFRNKNVAVVHLPASVTSLGAETFEKVLSTHGNPVDPGSVQYDLITRVYVENEKQYSDKTAFPESKYHEVVMIDYSSWTAAEFESSDGVITGLSNIGKDKIRKNGALIIPDADEDGNLFTEIGESAFAGCGVTSVSIPEGITAIGANSFKGNSIESLTIPASVAAIGNSAFEANEISVLAFAEAESAAPGRAATLLAASGANGLSIGSRAFADNRILAVQLPDGTETVAGDAFVANRGLGHVTEGTDEEKSGGVVNIYVRNPGAGVASIAGGTSNTQAVISDSAMPDPHAPWGAEDFSYDSTGSVVTGFSDSGLIKFVTNKDIVIPDTGVSGNAITEISDGAFAVDEKYVDVGKYDYNTEEGITSVVLPKHLAKIGKNAFLYNSLEAIDLENAAELTTIGETAFKGNHIRKVHMTDAVTTVGSGAFSANSITDIRMPHNEEFTVIPPAVFSMNIRMKKVEIPDQITEIGEMAFAGARLETLTIPSSVTKIGRKAFHLHHLTSLTIPGNVKELGESSFEGTFKEQTLKTLILEEGVETIGKYAFKEGLLTQVRIPVSLKTLGTEPFLNNTGYGDNHVVELYTTDESQLAFNEGAVTHHVSMVRELTSDNVTVKAVTYTGAAVKPDPVVEYDGQTLIEGTDYTVAGYENNVNAGTARVIIEGQCGYSGTVTQVFTIKPKSITPAVTLSTVNYTWNNGVKTPGVTVKDGTIVLKKGTDYTVTYQAGRKNIGKYNVTVTLKGNYSGKKVATFNINPKPCTIKAPSKAKKAFTAKWKKMATKMPKATVTGYQVQYSTVKTFKTGAKTVTVKGAKKVSRKISGLKAKTTYYVRVRTYISVGGKYYYSTWSSVKSVKTK